MASNRKLIDQMINQIAAQQGIDPNVLRSFVEIESGYNPSVRTGSYKGLMQLSDKQFAKYGGKGDIYNPQSNLRAGALKVKALQDDFTRKHGRAPEPWELYMTHQQGAGGYAAHAQDPTRPAWASMASTLEGRQKGEGWAKAAIWGNLPDSAKKQFGSVENVTSGDFMNWWQGRYGRAGGGPTRVTVSPTPPEPVDEDGAVIAHENPWSPTTMPTKSQPTSDVSDPSFWGQMLNFDGVDLSGLVNVKAPPPPSVRLVTAPTPRRNVNMSGINALAQRAGSKFGR